MSEWFNAFHKIFIRELFFYSEKEPYICNVKTLLCFSILFRFIIGYHKTESQKDSVFCCP